MTDKIEPALTAEEWTSPADALDGYFDLRDGVVDVRLGGAHGGGDLVGDTRKLIAFANAALPDSDPRKITRERIALLWSAASRAGESDVVFIEALESYLPPEKA